MVSAFAASTFLGSAPSAPRGRVAASQCPRRVAVMTAADEGRAAAVSSVMQNVGRGMAAVALASSIAVNTLPAFAEVPFDAPPTTPFFDDSGLVPKGTLPYLNNGLSKLKDSTGYDVHFVSVRSLPYDEDANDYAKELFEQWHLDDNSVVIVGATKVARAGGFAGNAAGSLLTQDIINSIGNTTYEYKAVEASYGSASLAVVNRLIPVLSGKEDPGPPARELENLNANFKSKEETDSQRGKYTKVVGFLLVVAFVVPMLQYWWYVR